MIGFATPYRIDALLSLCTLKVKQQPSTTGGSVKFWSIGGAILLLGASSVVAESQTVRPAPAARRQASYLPTADYLYPAAGAKIGQGWDSFNEQATTRSCVDVAEAPLERSNYETQVEHIKSTYSLLVKTASTVSASYGGFGASVSGSRSTTSSHSVSTDDQNFLFTFSSSHGSTFAAPPAASGNDGIELSDQAIKGLSALKSDNGQREYASHLRSRPPRLVGGSIKLTTEALALRQRSKKEFERLCGDGFVSTIHRGGRINLLLTQRAASEAAASSLAASLSASGYGASASGSFSTSTARLSTTDQLSYRVFQQGGLPMKPRALPTITAGNFFDVGSILPDVDQLLGNPAAFSVTVTPYENVVEDAEATEFPSPAKLFKLSDYYVALRDVYNLLGGILQSVRLSPGGTSTYEAKIIEIFGGESRLEELHDAMHFDLSILERAIAACYAEKRACTIDAAIQDARSATNAELPQLRALQSQPATPAAAQRKVVDRIQKIEDFDKSFVDNKLSPAFFWRFYQYLVLIPLPKAAYEGNAFAELNSFAVSSLANAATRAGVVAKANDALRRANLTFRVIPWKRFFCETLTSSPLCLSEASIRQIVEAGLPKLNDSNLLIVPPPQEVRRVAPAPSTVRDPADRVGFHPGWRW